MSQGPFCCHGKARSRSPIASLCCAVAAALFALHSFPSRAQQEQAPSSQQPVHALHGSARISVFPIDARGVTGNSASLALQHFQMREIADNTGGEAVYNRNWLGQAATKILQDDNSFYTLVFSPKDFHPDNKWHQVKVKVDGGPHTLSYRRGYFAGGKTKDLPADLHSSPIIFTATIVPAGNPPPTPGAEFYALSNNAPTKKGRSTYSVFYSLRPTYSRLRQSTAVRMLRSKSPSSASIRPGSRS